MWDRLRQATAAASRAGGGLWLDLALYATGAVFAWWTAAASTLPPHRAWATVAVVGYAAGTAAVAVQLIVARGPAATRLANSAARIMLTVAVWAATALLPLVIQAVQRSGGRTDRAQDEVMVIEDGGRRLLEAGTPYLDRTAIAALAPDHRLLGYLPYQPGMALFGTPRALDPTGAWWSDARVWFALVTGVCLTFALLLLRRAGAPAALLVRALQVATVLPICALTLATGANDLAVLALCLLALSLANAGRLGWAGLAVGVAAALKLFAWPILVVLGVLAFSRGREPGRRYAVSALGVVLLTAVPALVRGAGAMFDNVVAFPLGHGLVTSPAASPLPGHLLATLVPGGGTMAIVLLAAAGLAILVAMRRWPPRTADAAARISGYGLLAAFLLLPATRFGYLLYPAVLLVWAAALRPPTMRPVGPHAPTA